LSLVHVLRWQFNPKREPVMKTKQTNMIAKFTAKTCLSNAKNYSQEKEIISRYLVIDKKTERVIVDCRCYMGRSSNSSQVYASVWINSIKPLCDDAEGFATYTSGCGTAGGYGYHKESAAIGDAISSAGFTLFGSASGYDNKPDFKRICHIAGVGDSAIKAALLAIAYACGSKDVIFV
jgi:hypothetical protein